MSRARDLADSADLNFDDGTLVIDSGNNRVGIGTASPQVKVHIENGGALSGATYSVDDDITIENSEVRNSNINLITTNTTKSNILFSDDGGRGRGVVGYDHATDHLRFFTDNTEAMRIDSSGNLLVGKTANTNNTAGVRLANNGSIATADQLPVLYLNRTTNDGTLLELRKDDSIVGSIGTVNTDVYFGSGDANIRCRAGQNEIIPVGTGGTGGDATLDLGADGSRWKDLYLSGGVYLGGTGSANYLDDYEEGTFTPSFANFTVGNGSVFGTYTKIGNTVHCWYGLVFGTTSSFTGTVTNITGLPFTILSRTGAIYVKSNGVAWDNGNTWTSMMAMGADNSTGTQYPMRTSNSAALTATSPFTWANQDTLTFQITYETAS